MGHIKSEEIDKLKVQLLSKVSKMIDQLTIDKLSVRVENNMKFSIEQVFTFLAKTDHC